MLLWDKQASTTVCSFPTIPHDLIRQLPSSPPSACLTLSLSCQPTSQCILLSAVRCIATLSRPYPLHSKGHIFVSYCTKLWAPIDATTWHPESSTFHRYCCRSTASLYIN